MYLRPFLGIILLIASALSVAKEAAYCPPIATKSATETPVLNINTATAEELSSKLKGIGKAKAAAILEWREINGKFQSLEDVDEVKGIGPAILEKNKALIRFSD